MNLNLFKNIECRATTKIVNEQPTNRALQTGDRGDQLNN